MKPLLTCLFIFTMLLTSGCIYPGINGKVVDNVTEKPIEGAVVVAVWTKTHGFGLTYGTLEKATETITDKEGLFRLTGIYDPFVNPPDMIIYKEGYIPWRNDAIFPNPNKVKDHEWKNNVTYKLDVFSDKYTYNQIDFFLFLPVGGNEVPMFEAVKNKLSSEIRQRENTLLPLDFKGKIVDADTNKPIEGAMIFASDRYNKSSYGTSDIDGNITITGDYPMLERPPVIVVYKKGYIAQSSWDRGGVSLHPFKWHTGYVFQLKKCDIQSSWDSLEWHIGQLDGKSNQILRNLMTQEKSEK